MQVTECRDMSFSNLSEHSCIHSLHHKYIPGCFCSFRVCLGCIVSYRISNVHDWFSYIRTLAHLCSRRHSSHKSMCSYLPLGIQANKCKSPFAQLLSYHTSLYHLRYLVGLDTSVLELTEEKKERKECACWILHEVATGICLINMYHVEGVKEHGRK